MPSCVLKIDKDRNIKKWFDVPRNEYTGEARAMGIEFGPDGDLYLVEQRGLDRRAPHGVHRAHPPPAAQRREGGGGSAPWWLTTWSAPTASRWGDYMYAVTQIRIPPQNDKGLSS